MIPQLSIKNVLDAKDHISELDLSGPFSCSPVKVDQLRHIEPGLMG